MDRDSEKRPTQIYPPVDRPDPYDADYQRRQHYADEHERDRLERISRWKLTQIIDYIYWVFMALVLLRFIFRLLDAAHTNTIVNFVYKVTGPLIAMFKGIASDIPISGPRGPVFEISSLIALLGIWLIYHAVLKLISLMSGRTP